MKIKVEELRQYLLSIKREEIETAFQKPENPKLETVGTHDGWIKRQAYMGEETMTINPQKHLSYGDYFLVDAIGCDLSLCKLTRREYRIGGRKVGMKLIMTLIADTRKQYGNPINDMWLIPKQFICN